MEDLSRIEARLESLGELGELIGALRSVAAARTREAQEAFAGTHAYRAIVQRAIAGIAPQARSGRTAGEGGREDGMRILLVVCSEHGFVGGFNARVVDTALAAREKGERLAVIGRRGEATAAERGATPDTVAAMTLRPSGVTALARRLADETAHAGSVRLVHASLRKGGTFEVETRRILPLEPHGEAPGGFPPLHHHPTGELLAALAAERVFAEIAHALMESLAAESGARLVAMDAASRNIEDRLERLRRDVRAARQDRMTAEMLDVVTGAEAVEGG